MSMRSGVTRKRRDDNEAIPPKLSELLDSASWGLVVAMALAVGCVVALAIAVAGWLS